MQNAVGNSFAYHQMLVLVAGNVCLAGTWIGMRHFARARATEGSTRYGWLFMASVGTGATLWASTFISILALDPLLNSGFEPVATAAVLVIGIVACLIGFEIGSRHFTLAPELGGLMMGIGILAMHFLGLKAWHFAGTTQWNWHGVVVTFVLGLGLSALSVNRANRPVTRWCRHGAAIVLAFMICVMHYALTVTTTMVPDASVVLPPYLIPAGMLGFAVLGAVLLVMGSGFSTYVIDLHARTESADRIHQLSFNDTMTGLPNRIAFNERLAYDAALAHEKAHRLAAFSIDIDGFKDVNDLDARGARARRVSRPPERRRVFGIADVGQPAARRPRFCRPHRRGIRAALPDRRPTGHAHRFDRLLGISDRHAGTRPGAFQRQAGDAPRQDQATRLDHRLSARDGRYGPCAARAGARPAIGHRAQRADAVLPAADFADRRQGLWR
jgi:NO-binding membrane sensor protein with MHYT domain